MVRLSNFHKRRQQILKANLRRKAAALSEGLLACFATIVTGISYSSVILFCSILGIITSSLQSFYNNLPRLEKVFHRKAKQSCQKYQRQMSLGSCVALDGSWDHRRHAHQCIVSAIDVTQNKVIDYEVINNYTQHYKTNNVTNLSVSGSNLEMEGVKILVQRLKNNPNIEFYVHDDDGKTRSVIKDSKWEVCERLDPNHSLIIVERFLKKELQGKKQFYGLKTRLMKWITTLSKMNISIEERQNIWKTTALHLIGDHSKCQHPALSNEKKYPEEMKPFLEN